VLQFEYYLVMRVQLTDALAIAEHVEACPTCGQELVLFRVTRRGRLSG
jgi:hypothetical protein